MRPREEWADYRRAKIMDLHRLPARLSRPVPQRDRANRWVAGAVGVASLPWLAAGELELFWLGIAAWLTAATVAWLPEFGRPITVGCGFFIAAALSCHPVLAGSWHPWQSAARQDWCLANVALVGLPCLLMVVSRAWALELLSDAPGCENQADGIR